MRHLQVSLGASDRGSMAAVSIWADGFGHHKAEFDS